MRKKVFMGNIFCYDGKHGHRGLHYQLRIETCRVGVIFTLSVFLRSHPQFPEYTGRKIGLIGKRKVMALRNRGCGHGERKDNGVVPVKNKRIEEETTEHQAGKMAGG